MHKPDGSRRANLVVGHESDKWWAYCQACKCGDVVLKTHVRLTDRATKESNKVDPPTDVVPAQKLLKPLREGLETFLLSKGVTGSMLPDWGYSAKRNRLVLQPDSWDGRSLGRDVSQKSNIKWIVYGKQGDTHVLEPLKPGAGRGTLYLTEDVFSMYKLKWALSCYHAGLPWCDTWVGTTLGTGITQKLLAELVGEPFKQVVVFYDGDRAGVQGSKTVAHRIGALLPSSKVIPVTAPTGLDPKDMQYDDILKHLNLYGGQPV